MTKYFGAMQLHLCKWQFNHLFGLVKYFGAITLQPTLSLLWNYYSNGFKLIFNNGEIRETNLEPLIGDYVSLKNIQTARIDPEWGCLEFNAGMVDIEPNTLYLHII